jgi:hypothetical protein
MKSSIYIAIIWLGPHGGVGREEARENPVVQQVTKTGGSPSGSVAIHHKDRSVVVVRKAFDKVLTVVSE